jgi:hypothetical protein
VVLVAVEMEEQQVLEPLELQTQVAAVGVLLRLLVLLVVLA